MEVLSISELIEDLLDEGVIKRENRKKISKILKIYEILIDLNSLFLDEHFVSFISIVL